MVILLSLEKQKKPMGDGSILPPGACDRSILVWEKDGESRGGDGPDGGGHMELVGAVPQQSIIEFIVLGRGVWFGVQWVLGSGGEGLRRGILVSGFFFFFFFKKIIKILDLVVWLARKLLDGGIWCL